MVQASGTEFAPKVASLLPTSNRSPDALALAAFQSNGAEDRLTDLLAFAMAVESGETPGAATVERLRARAGAELADHAARATHNRIDEIRRDAVAEHIGHLRRPPGLVKLILANLVALGIGAAILVWLQANPALFSRILAWLGG